MVDMPTIMLRMKLVETYSLKELVEMFNHILKMIADPNSGTPIQPAAAANFHFPDVFNKPRDLYVAALLHEICS